MSVVKNDAIANNLSGTNPVTITMTIPRSAVSDPSKVVIFRRTDAGVSSRLTTTYTRSGSNYVFSAQSPGLSVFAAIVVTTTTPPSPSGGGGGGFGVGAPAPSAPAAPKKSAGGGSFGDFDDDIPF